MSSMNQKAIKGGLPRVSDSALPPQSLPTGERPDQRQNNSVPSRIEQAGDRSRPFNPPFKQTIKRLLRPIIRRGETWSIGIYKTDSALNLIPAVEAKNPVLTAKDVTEMWCEFVADPFLVKRDGAWWMFFEALNLADDRGVIALASSANGYDWNYEQVVLAEPFHLSYPYVFEWNQEYYMVPESYQANEVRLYKAKNFPTQWVFQKTLLSGCDYVDSSLIYFNQKWWMFSSSASENILWLYYADDLLGEWTEHPQSPITPAKSYLARPAGRVAILNDRIIRFAQDCQIRYGRQIVAFEVTELTQDHYGERELHSGVPILSSETGWNAYGTHHIDLHQVAPNQWLACVDGKTKPAIKILGFPFAR